MAILITCCFHSGVPNEILHRCVLSFCTSPFKSCSNFFWQHTPLATSMRMTCFLRAPEPGMSSRKSSGSHADAISPTSSSSPTASPFVYNLLLRHSYLGREASQQPAPQRTTRSVSFDQAMCKPHDGLSPRARALFQVLSRVVIEGEQIPDNEEGFFAMMGNKQGHVEGVVELRKDIKKLILVLLDQPSCPMMLQGGGGHRSYRLTQDQIPRLVNLYEVLAKVQASITSCSSTDL